MNIKKFVRNVVIGETRHIESLTEFKQVLLSGQFAMIAMGTVVINLFLDHSLSLTFLVYVAEVLLFAFSIVLHRWGKHIIANYCMLITANLAIYCFTSSESIATGIFTYYIVIAIGSFAIFSHNRRLHAIIFTALAFTLFCLSYFAEFRILPWRDIPYEEILLAATVNVFLAIVASSAAVSLLISLNHESALQLSENNKLLVKTNAELDRFVYSASHDLRAPLSSLLGLINISKKATTLEESAHYLEMMEDRVLHLDNFIREIIDYSRNTRLEVKKDRVNLGNLIEEVLSSLKFLDGASHLKIEKSLPNDLEIWTDTGRLKVILSNLISNSIRYSDSAKASPFVLIEAVDNGTDLKICVADNGQGIATEHHSKIFEMFYRASFNSKGSGLGLYIVSETLRRIGASIEMTSELGKGSTFIITLPNPQNEHS